MTHLATILGLAVSSNLDTLGVAVAYGARKFRLTFLPNFICALIPSAGTFVMMIAGSAARRFVSSPLANLLGAGIIAVAGVVLIVQFLVRTGTPGSAERRYDIPAAGSSAAGSRRFSLNELRRVLKDPLRADYDTSGTIEAKEAMVLALALTLNNLSNGFAAGLMGLSIPLMVGSSFVISIILFYAGIWMGLLFIARWLGKWSELAAGILLLFLGIYEMLT